MKKISFVVFVSLICFLQINIQPQFAAVIQNSRETNVRGESSVGRLKSIQSQKQEQQNSLWQPVSEDKFKGTNRLGISQLQNYLVFQLNKTALTQILASVPAEAKGDRQKNLSALESPVIMELPLPDGTLTRIEIEESSVLEPDLATQFPEIKSYRGRGIDDPNLSARFDWTPQGLHALILTGSQTINLQPANQNDTTLYVSFYDSDLNNGKIECLVKDFESNKAEMPEVETPIFDSPETSVGTTLRTYRIALATTYEYSQTYGGGTVAGTVSSLNTWLNGANAVYERELSIHMNLVNNTSVLYTADRGFTASTDPYDNSNVSTMLDQVRPDLGNNVGSANYDLGHVFGTAPAGYAGSGVSYVGVVNNNSSYGVAGPLKGGGATQLGGSTGNSGALGVWVHELGHEFGANHNFNGSLFNCGGGQHSNATSYESGSGSTIMGYSGICGGDDISNTRDMRFHPMSYLAINNYISTYANNYSASTTGNSAPTVNGGGNHYIPKNTPFTLTAIGSDPNGDSLTYTWDEIDAGGASYPQDGTTASYTDANDPQGTTRPIFRPMVPSTSPSRTFPSLTYILNYSNNPPATVGGLQTAEELPRVGRTVNFRVTARDNRLNGGGVNEDTVVLTVDNNSGPFLITSPNTNVTVSGGTSQLVTWSVNNTNVSPISATNVNILLSTDGGNTFPTVLTANTPNDGSESVTLPNITTSSARIKVEAVGNVFFDISDANFTINASTTVNYYEADVAPRGNPDGRVSSLDVAQIQSFQLGYGLPYQGNEFQRADCAPLATQGDGRISSLDVAQAQAYQLGLTSLQIAGGPTSPIISAGNLPDLLAPMGAKSYEKNSVSIQSAREVRVANTNATIGQTVTVPIQVDAVGDESVYGFSLNYDSTKLANPVVTIGNAGGSVSSNTTTAGQIGISVSFGGGTIMAGNNQILINVQFTVLNTATTGSSNITFGDTPTIREVASSPSNPGGVMALPTTFTSGSVNISAQPTAALSSIMGYVKNSNGFGLSNVSVTLVDTVNGLTQTTLTNSEGSYRFDNLPAGGNYVVTPQMLRYTFSPSSKFVSLTENLAETDFTAASSKSKRRF